MRKVDILPPSCAVVTKFGNLNFLEPSGSLRACNGTALPLPLPTPYLHQIYTLFAPSLHYVSITFTAGLHNIYIMFAPWLHHIYTGLTACLQHFYSIFTPRFLLVYTMFTADLHHIYITFAPCLNHEGSLMTKQTWNKFCANVVNLKIHDHEYWLVGISVRNKQDHLQGLDLVGSSVGLQVRTELNGSSVRD